MSINWIEAYYWQLQEQNPALTPGQKAPLVSVGCSNSDQSFTEQGLASVPKKMPEPQQPILLTLRNFQRANVTDVTGIHATIADQTENP